MFIKNCWYVAAWDIEVPEDGMLARTLLNEPVLLYRGSEGQVVALENRCCHRAAPLHLGRKEGDCIRCMYHGLKFDPSGACVEIPGQDKIPPKTCIKSYRVVERHRLVWIWMGDPAMANPDDIVDHHWHDSPDWRMKPGYIHYQANYKLIVDNLLDFTHLAWVHPTTLGTESAAALKPAIERDTQGNGTLNLPGHVAVYIPQAYAFAGITLIVDRALVEPVAVEPADVMAFVVSAGVTRLERPANRPDRNTPTT